jgi:hypothetical protein
VTDDPGPRPPGPGPLVRLIGAGAVAGAVLWPISLSGIASSLVAEAGGGGASAGSNPIVPLAIALLLFAAAVGALERAATTEIRFVDLVGGLSIGMAAVVVALAAILGSLGFLGPGLAVLFVGSIIFGAAGLNGKRRPRWGSALVGSGAGGLLACFVVAASLGASRLDDLAQTAFVSLLLYAVGWAWLGLHLSLGRSLDVPTVEESQVRKRADRN